MEFEIYNVDTSQIIAEAVHWADAKYIAEAFRKNDRDSDYRAREKQVS